MAGFTIEFNPWDPFHAYKKSPQAWLQEIADAAKAIFTGGMGQYPPASAPGAWPNVRTGKLKASVATEVGADEMTIGSNMRYSIFLRTGTSKMARRKMSDSALQEAMRSAKLGRWAYWVKG